jgi:hypothetical protein
VTAEASVSKWKGGGNGQNLGCIGAICAIASVQCTFDTLKMSQQKLNYKLKSKLEVFYTGGALALSRDGKTLACACADEVKVC